MKLKLLTLAFGALAASVSHAAITGSVVTFTQNKITSTGLLVHKYDAQPLRMGILGNKIESQFNGWIYAAGPMAPSGWAFRKLKVTLNGTEVGSITVPETVGKSILPNVTYTNTITESMLLPVVANEVVFTLEYAGGGSTGNGFESWYIRGLFYRS